MKGTDEAARNRKAYAVRHGISETSLSVTDPRKFSGKALHERPCAKFRRARQSNSVRCFSCGWLPEEHSEGT